MPCCAHPAGVRPRCQALRAGQRGRARLCRESHAWSSESTVPACHVSGGAGVCEAFLPRTVVYTPRARGHSPERAAEPCRRSRRGWRADPARNGVCRHFCERRGQPEPGTRAAASERSSAAPAASQAASCTDWPSSSRSLTFRPAHGAQGVPFPPGAADPARGHAELSAGRAAGESSGRAELLAAPRKCSCRTCPPAPPRPSGCQGRARPQPGAQAA